MGGDHLEVEQIQGRLAKMKLTDVEYAMLGWIEKLTLAPVTRSEGDIQRLRNIDWSGRDILNITNVCAYFNFRVRTVAGFGVENWLIRPIRPIRLASVGS